MASAAGRELSQARRSLAEAREHFARRQGRQAVAALHLACFRAACGLSRAAGLALPGEPVDARPGELDPGGPAGKSLAAFYRQLGSFCRRVADDPDTKVNIEEVANWLRQAEWFVGRMAGMARRHGA